MLALCLVLCATGTNAKDEGETKNGYWWLKLKTDAKVAFVEGYVAGTMRAYLLLHDNERFNKQVFIEELTRKPAKEYLDCSQIAYGQ